MEALFFIKRYHKNTIFKHKNNLLMNIKNFYR